MELKKWMKSLPDSSDLLSLNLVGTHDCVTQYVQFSHISKCQNTDIYGQLNIGIRALDIRVEAHGDRLGMVHGIAKAFNKNNHFSKQMDMADVLKHCYRFLDENPSEAIVFQFKNDSRKEMELCFDNLFNTYIKPNKCYWFCENRAVTLGEARGKIVLLRRCDMAQKDEYTDENTGIDFSSWVEQDTAVPEPLTMKAGASGMTFIIQDRFKYKPEPRWNECIKPFLDTMGEFNGTYIINYLSTAGGLKGPYNNSKYINPHFMDYPLSKDYYYGTVYTDFPTKELVEKIISTNFKDEA